MEVFNLDQALIKKIIDSGYQHISLSNSEGKKIISFNPDKKNFQKKLEEIKKRFALLPDGLYQLLLQWNYGGGNPDIMLLKKGNQPVENINTPVIHKPQKTNLSEPVNVLSYDKALENIQTISNLEARVRELETENKRLLSECEELTKELEEGAPLGEGLELNNSVTGWLKEITPILAPLADRYFDTENKRLQIQEREQYFKYGQLQKKKPQIIPRKRPQQTSGTKYPDVNNEADLNAFFDELEKLNEAEFLEALKVIEVENPPLYALVYHEFLAEEEEEEEEEKKEN